MRKPLIVGLALLSGCASWEQINNGRFDIIEDDTFTYHVEVQPVEMEEVSPESEQRRRQWIQNYLDLNEMCPQGYDIVKRRNTAILQTLNGKRYRVAYTGKCRT